MNSNYLSMNSDVEKVNLHEEKMCLDNINILMEKLKNSEERFMHLYSTMSHEIRTPINGMISILDLIEKTKLNSQQKEYFNMLKTSSYLILDIINNILYMSKIEAGELELNKSLFNLKDMIDIIMNQFQLSAHAKGVKLMYYIEPFIKLDIIGDKLRLNQVLVNILNNAIKFTDKGHIILSVKKVHSNREKIKFQFSVEDTGIGIDCKFKDRIFQVFSQENSSYAKRYGGTGLGLPISKEIVKLMNGDMWFESKKGLGSTFYFTAEFSLSPMGKIEDNSSLVQQKKLITKNKVNLNSVVLVVEDNEINMEIVKSLLKKKGIKHICANNGKEAIKTLEREHVDLILMDIQMPELNGYDTSMIIREKENLTLEHVKIIAMTAYANGSDKRKCIEAGMDDYIAKPFNTEDLYKKIVKYL